MDPNRVIFGNWAIKRPANQPNGRLPENRRHPKYLIIWGSDDPIELGPYEPKIRGLHRCNIQSGRSSLAKHGGAYFSAVYGFMKDLIAAPGPYENQEV